MKKLIEVSQDILKEGYIRNKERHDTFKEAIAEAATTIEGIQACWDAYEKAGMIDSAPNWNLPFWQLLSERTKPFLLSSDIGTLRILSYKEEMEIGWTYKVSFTAPDSKIYTAVVDIPSYLKRGERVVDENPLLFAISKALCLKFGNIDITSFEKKRWLNLPSS